MITYLKIIDNAVIIINLFDKDKCHISLNYLYIGALITNREIH